MLHIIIRNALAPRILPVQARSMSSGTEVLPTNTPSSAILAEMTMQPVHDEYNAEREEQYAVLPDNINISFSEYGDPKGKPVFFFHGSIGCRYDGAELHKPAKKLGIRIVSPDRPGHGLSSLNPNRTLLDYPKDIERLATYLNFDRYHCLGISGGGPFAVACAYGINSARLIRSGVIAGMAPWFLGQAGVQTQIKYATLLLAYCPWIFRQAYKYSFPISKLRDDKFMSDLQDKIDKQLSTDGQDLTTEERQMMRVSTSNAIRQGYRQGPDGVLTDGRIFTSDWGFKLEDVGGEVKLWFGTKDTHTPIWHARYMAEKIPKAKLKEYEGATHMNIQRNYEEILRELIDSDPIVLT